MAQDESSVSGSGSLADGNATSDSSSTADESSAPESGSNAGADVSQPESDSMPVESDSSISDGSEVETSSSLPVSESTVSDETESVLIEEGDMIDIDIPARSIQLRVSDDELKARRQKMDFSIPTTGPCWIQKLKLSTNILFPIF